MGLASVVPSELLPLFTWKQLETLVTGNPEIDIDLLMSKTVREYQNRT